jgi:hypothetical protein
MRRTAVVPRLAGIVRQRAKRTALRWDGSASSSGLSEGMIACSSHGLEEDIPVDRARACRGSLLGPGATSSSPYLDSKKPAPDRPPPGHVERYVRHTEDKLFLSRHELFFQAYISGGPASVTASGGREGVRLYLGESLVTRFRSFEFSGLAARLTPGSHARVQAWMVPTPPRSALTRNVESKNQRPTLRAGFPFQGAPQKTKKKKKNVGLGDGLCF